MLPLHLLLLDHDPERRRALADWLRAAEHRVLATSDAVAGAEALTTATDGLTPDFDLLVLDLGLPELDLPALRRALAPDRLATPDSLDSAERRHIAHMLRHTAGNKRQAARLLGISRSTLLNKVRKYGLDPQREPDQPR